MHRLTRPVVVAVSALALCGVGAGVALASPDAAPAVVGKAPRHPGEHGEFTGTGKAHRTLDYQRGTVTAADGTSITVRSEDGFTATYTFAPKVRVREDRKTATPAQVRPGDRVFVAAVKAPTGLQAVRVRDRGPAPAPAPAGS